MTENNKNNLPFEDEKTASADDDMFEELKQKYKESYSPREKCVQKMKKVFSAKEIYLITLVPKKDNKNKVYLKVNINTCDGLENNYQAEIKKELVYLANRCLFNKILPPPAVAIKDKKIGLLATGVEQYHIIEKLFFEKGNYEWGYVAVMSEDLPTLYPPENKQSTPTSEN